MSQINDCIVYDSFFLKYKRKKYPNIEAFKQIIRQYQVPTQVFYSAYGDLTIEVINNNTWIRHRLHQPASAGGLDTWFRRLT